MEILMFEAVQRRQSHNRPEHGIASTIAIGQNARGAAGVGSIRDTSAMHDKLFATTARKKVTSSVRARHGWCRTGKIVSNAVSR